MISQFYIAIDGKAVDEAFRSALERVTVENSLHLPDVATLQLHDPRLFWVDHASIEPGKRLTIAAKGSGDKGPLFDGEIVEVEPIFEPDTQRLLVRSFDRLHRLSRGRHVRSFVDVTDGDLIEKLAREVNLQVRTGPTRQVHPYVFQNNESNLAFLQRRAAALGYLLYVDGETLCCTPPETDSQPLQLKWGESLATFQPRLTTLGQVNSVVVRGWNPATKEAIIGEARTPKGAPLVGDQKSGGEVAATAFDMQASFLVASSPVRTQVAADRLAQATVDRLGGRFIEAEGSVGAMPALIAGVSVQVSGVGKRFGGTYFVTSSAHTYDNEQGYQVHFTVSGLHPSTLLGLLAGEAEPDLGSLVIGIVTDNNDPDRQGRVKVKFPWLSNDHTSDWARVVVVGGGSERGIQFLPEINDEVLVGFELGDMHFPYVLGGLWNGRDAPAARDQALLDGGKVQRRVLRSRAGHTITLDDADSSSSIAITDEAGNSIVLDSRKKSVLIDARGDLALNADGNVSIKGKGTIDIQGTRINLN